MSLKDGLVLCISKFVLILAKLEPFRSASGNFIGEELEWFSSIEHDNEFFNAIGNRVNRILVSELICLCADLDFDVMGNLLLEFDGFNDICLHILDEFDELATAEVVSDYLEYLSGHSGIFNKLWVYIDSDGCYIDEIAILQNECDLCINLGDANAVFYFLCVYI